MTFLSAVCLPPLTLLMFLLELELLISDCVLRRRSASYQEVFCSSQVVLNRLPHFMGVRDSCTAALPASQERTGEETPETPRPYHSAEQDSGQKGAPTQPRDPDKKGNQKHTTPNHREKSQSKATKMHTTPNHRKSQSKATKDKRARLNSAGTEMD